MNGATKFEMKKLRELREMMKVDREAAIVAGGVFLRASKRRKALRFSLLRCIKGMFSQQDKIR